MRAWVAALVFATLLGGCADNSRAGLEVRLATFVGQSSRELYRRLGAPDRIVDTANGPIMVYIDRWPIISTPNGLLNEGMVQERLCVIAFRTERGVVAGFEVRGEVCGWGGYPMILP